MEENNRINRRSRPRPYDLRRKVLLKNFLREQLTYIPGVQIESMSSNEDANNSREPTISLHLDEDLPELNDENTSSSATHTEEQCSSNPFNTVDSSPVVSSNNVENGKDTASDTNGTSDSSHESSLFKFSSILKIKRDPKKKQKGIIKAKDVRKNVKSPTKSRSFKSNLERIFYRPKRPSESSVPSSKSRNSPRSLFSLFKNRVSQRNVNVDRTMRSSYLNNKSYNFRTKNTAMSQSVQTEDSWAREELFKVQQSNRLLREENRLLSESLSYFMSNSSMDSQLNHNNSQLQTNKNYFNTGYHDYYPSSSNTSNNWYPKSRIVRSKSVQDHSDRRATLRNNYRTRSMNCHNVRNKVLLPDPKPHVSTFSAHSERYNFPRVKRKDILANLPVNSASRGIQRRSSMPERPLSENNKSVVCRRSGSFRDSYNRKPFYSLPSEAFY